MTCQDCGCLLPTDQTIRATDVDTRTHTCPCGSRFLSEQRIIRRLLSAHKGVANGVHAPPRAAAIPPAGVGGVGGGLPSGSLSGVSDPNSKLNSARVGRKLPDESPEFDRLWDGNRRVGRRLPALKAWHSAGRPDVTKLIELWDAWSRTDDWKRGAIPYLSKWINEHGWKDDPAVCAPKRDQGREMAPWELRQQRAREEAAARERERSARDVMAVDRKVAEVRQFANRNPVAAHIAALANAKGNG